MINIVPDIQETFHRYWHMLSIDLHPVKCECAGAAAGAEETRSGSGDSDREVFENES